MAILKRILQCQIAYFAAALPDLQINICSINLMQKLTHFIQSLAECFNLHKSFKKKSPVLLFSNLSPPPPNHIRIMCYCLMNIHIISLSIAQFNAVFLLFSTSLVVTTLDFWKICCTVNDFFERSPAETLTRAVKVPCHLNQKACPAGDLNWRWGGVRKFTHFRLCC